MVKLTAKFICYLALLPLLTACPELKEAGRSIGHTAKNVTTDIGHGSRDTVHALGKGTKRVVKSITSDTDKP